MHSVLLLGCGKIGRTIAALLGASGDYRVRAADVDCRALAVLDKTLRIETVVLDANDPDEISSACRGCQSIVSALSYRFNPLVAQVALNLGASYFDLTEDVQTTRKVRQVAARAATGQVFMPQCGLAPGFISLLAYHLTKSFDTLDTVQMRVGALPQFPTGALKYNLTWSTDGLINEYCNPCEAIHQGQRVDVLPLEGVELFSLDGVEYEAFNTSGGLGTLCETLEGKVRELNYRTIRYVGHRDLADFLVSDLRLGERRDVLKDILEHAIPVTFQDVVVIFSTVTGWRQGRFVQVSDARKIYQTSVEGRPWSAIQITTAAGVCAALDLHVAGKLPSSGFVRQEDIEFDQFIDNRFGRYYRMEGPVNWSRLTTDEKGGGDGSSAVRSAPPASRSL
ncbi:MAG: saccharopine dehydrogenase NADP-binding domain-containing protein [Planctomycetes bacterium]|nr:saccharopine dehydrogenase NADP-binding domain-containing protein [Planctomycetota bacterium]MBL7037860.1 saccharopine dehydrogenase NADP-binding domain-containing protein [Pirellulaceae bacterium]